MKRRTLIKAAALMVPAMAARAWTPAYQAVRFDRNYLRAVADGRYPVSSPRGFGAYCYRCDPYFGDLGFYYQILSLGGPGTELNVLHVKGDSPSRAAIQVGINGFTAWNMRGAPHDRDWHTVVWFVDGAKGQAIITIDRKPVALQTQVNQPGHIDYAGYPIFMCSQPTKGGLSGSKIDMAFMILYAGVEADPTDPKILDEFIDADTGLPVQGIDPMGPIINGKRAQICCTGNRNYGFAQNYASSDGWGATKDFDPKPKNPFEEINGQLGVTDSDPWYVSNLIGAATKRP